MNKGSNYLPDRSLIGFKCPNCNKEGSVRRDVVPGFEYLFNLKGEKIICPNCNSVFEIVNDYTFGFVKS